MGKLQFQKNFIENKEFRFQFTIKKNTAKIEYIGVKPRFRKSGIGKDVVMQFIEFCKKQNITKIEIDCYKKAVEFWKKVGFEIGNRQVAYGTIQDYYDAHYIL